MSEDYLKMFTGVVLLIFVIIAGYFFSERNDRKMFLLMFQWLLAHYRTLRASTGSEEYLSVLCCHQYGPE